MSMYNDDDLDTFDGDEAPVEESNNRTFLLVAGGLGVVVLLALVCLVGYLFLGNNNSQAQAEQTLVAQQTEQQATIAAGLTQNAQVQALTQAAAVTDTPLPTDTPVVAQATETSLPTENPATATVAAAFTQIAVSTQTIIPTSTALPNTGFADDVGIPGMFALALALVIVIFLVRRLRATPAR